MVPKKRTTAREVRNRRDKGKRFESKVAGLIVAAFCDSGLECFEHLESDMARRRRVWEVSEEQRGDVIIRDEVLRKAFPWTVECKAQKAMPSLERLLVGRTKLWQEAWEQAVDQADMMANFPLLVWRKKQNDPIMCAIPSEEFIMYDVKGETTNGEFIKGEVVVCAFSVFLEAAVNYGLMKVTDHTHTHIPEEGLIHRLFLDIPSHATLEAVE